MEPHGEAMEIFGQDTSLWTSLSREPLRSSALQQIHVSFDIHTPRSVGEECFRLLAQDCAVTKGGGRDPFVAVVQGKSASDVYLVFPQHFCSCQAFFFKVVHESETICNSEFKIDSGAEGKVLRACHSLYVQCKHQLAARLALALGRCPIITVSDVEIASMLAFGS
eukprot:1108543-Pelagomonas_calceolata.AAC.3